MKRFLSSLLLVGAVVLMLGGNALAAPTSVRVPVWTVGTIGDCTPEPTPTCTPIPTGTPTPAPSPTPEKPVTPPKTGDVTPETLWVLGGGMAIIGGLALMYNKNKSKMQDEDAQ